MDILPETIKELRSRTQAGFLDCKKALVETDGDMEKAIDLIRKRGMAAAVKRAGRSANEGKVAVVKAAQTIVLFELNSETDFVAKNDLFLNATDAIKKVIETYVENNPGLAVSPKQVLELILKDEHTSHAEWRNKSVAEFVQLLSGTIGEKIELNRVQSLNATEGETLSSYVHAGDKIATAVAVSGDQKSEDVTTLSRDLSMHVAASSPLYLSSNDVPQDEIEKEKAIIKEQVNISGKPENIIEKIVEGKLKNYFGQVCLLQQPFIKEPKTTVEKYIEQVSKKVGEPIQIKGFIRINICEKQ